MSKPTAESVAAILEQTYSLFFAGSAHHVTRDLVLFPLEHLRIVATYIKTLEAEAVEHQQSFDLYARAQMRGIRMWQDAHPGNDLVWPSTDKLTEWLIGELDALTARFKAMDDAARERTAGHHSNGPGTPLGPLYEKIRAAAIDMSDATSATLTGLEAFVAMNLLDKLVYLEDMMQRAGNAFDRRDANLTMYLTMLDDLRSQLVELRNKNTELLAELYAHRRHLQRVCPHTETTTDERSSGETYTVRCTTCGAEVGSGEYPQ
jgi:hypothetical protein